MGAMLVVVLIYMLIAILYSAVSAWEDVKKKKFRRFLYAALLEAVIFLCVVIGMDNSREFKSDAWVTVVALYPMCYVFVIIVTIAFEKKE